MNERAEFGEARRIRKGALPLPEVELIFDSDGELLSNPQGLSKEEVDLFRLGKKKVDFFGKLDDVNPYVSYRLSDDSATLYDEALPVDKGKKLFVHLVYSMIPRT